MGARSQSQRLGITRHNFKIGDYVEYQTPTGIGAQIFKDTIASIEGDIIILSMSGKRFLPEQITLVTRDNGETSADREGKTE